MQTKWIEASAGCGKTTFLLNEYNNDTQNSLFITFSNAAVEELKDRIQNKAKICTLHSLAHSVLLTKHAHINIAQNSLETEALSILLKDEKFKNSYLWLRDNYDGIIEQVEGISFFMDEELPIIHIEKFVSLFQKELIEKNVFLELKSVFFTNNGDIRKKIKLDVNCRETIKYNYINQVLERIKKHEKNIKKHAFLIKNELFLTLKLKENELKLKNNVIYYDDLISNSIKLLKEDNLVVFSVLKNISTVYIDEAQDLSDSLWELVFLILSICKKQFKKVFVAGDSKQLIYEFQGASIQVFHEYKEKICILSDVFQEIFLNKTYRIAKNICTFINNICSKLNIDFVNHETANLNDGNVQIIKLESLEEIINFISIDTMILFKQKTEKMEKLALNLMMNGYFLNSSYSIYHPIFQDFQYLLRWLIYQDPLALGVIANVFRYDNMHFNDLILLQDIKDLSNLKYIDLIDLFYNWISIKKVYNFYYEKLKQSCDFFIKLLFKYANFYRYTAYEAIFDKDNFYKSNLNLFKEGVFFNTIHASKGKEADTVILLDCDINTKFYIDTERLLYVALTRVKNNLIIPLLKEKSSKTWANLMI